ncbi:histone deacetylase [Streptomyces sp. NBC_01477]|uniref:histone deacetylase n=1 Tax=Streptomyces sp. NBC_01477 TaxID=2976015 RepID=UPI003FCEB4C8
MSSFERVGTGSGEPQPLTHVWYVSYGSNMCMERLRYYLAGGRPPHGSRVYPGARDARMPAVSVSVELPGTVYFATESPVWTGGRAFYDADAAGRAWGRAHLVTLGQFSDIAAQEMYRQPGPDLDVTEAVRVGRAELGAGRYETLVHAGERAGVPLLTFTAPWRVNDVEWTKPSATYLSLLASGLIETGSWAPDPVAEYLSTRPGAAGHWTVDTVRNLIRPLPG